MNSEPLGPIPRGRALRLYLIAVYVLAGNQVAMVAGYALGMPSPAIAALGIALSAAATLAGGILLDRYLHRLGSWTVDLAFHRFREEISHE